MYVVTVTFEVAPNDADTFRTLMLEQAANSLAKEPDCHFFDVCFAPDSPTTCFLYEKYTDRAAFDVHLASEHFKTFDTAVQPMLVNKQVNTWIEATSA